MMPATRFGTGCRREAVKLLTALAAVLVAALAGAQMPLPDGTPLDADQFPRFLQPTHSGAFGFDVFRVLGDFPTVTFERRDLDAPAGHVVETWVRTAVSTVAGRPVSIFRPTWTPAVLRAVLRTQRWGVDRPYLWWGTVVVPAAGAPVRRDVYLQIVPTNLPAAPTVQVGASVQYASHAVNLWIPGFAEAGPVRGDPGLDLAAVARRFYELFADDYDTLAIVSQATLFVPQRGFRRVVQNRVAGIGLTVFDESAAYGSTGALEGVEFYPPGGWTTNRYLLHQQAHQWSEYSRVWERLGVARVGDDPLRHTPLIAPGAVVAGAALPATRRVAGAETVAPVIERTPAPIGLHPLTLYRMGLIPIQELPELRVFQAQGQFDSLAGRVPAVGTRVEGASQSVPPSAFVVADGPRHGPAATRLRRAVVYVSRGGLASQAEMDVVNYYAARLAEQRGVTSWEGYPGFFTATAGRATLATDITPQPGMAPADRMAPGGAAYGYLDLAADTLTGVRLDAAIPGRLTPQQPVTLAGSVTADDRDDFTIVCFRFLRYGAVDPNEIFMCDSLSGNRFSIDHRFTPQQRGVYTVEPFLFWARSGSQHARARYGVVTVE